MILTDGIHLVSDISLNELHNFAQSINLKRHWFQGARKQHPHYDLTTVAIFQKAWINGAIIVNSKELIRRMVRR